MKPLSDNDIESEISYAYLHAVVSHAGAGCHGANRASDNNGIDATVTGWGPFPGGGYLNEVDIKVQLKATVTQPIITNGYLSYFLSGVNRYDDLRSNSIAVPRFLVVMFLPTNSMDWLTISENELLMQKCAYWVSLRGALPTTNASGQTIYIPQTQIFNSTNLKNIFRELSGRNHFTYVAP